MSKGIIPLSILENIAKAIRYVNGLSTKYKPSEMENAIRGLKKSLGQKTITSNGTYSPSADNLDGYSEVTVTVEGGSVLVSKNIVQNGTYDPTDDNADGYNSVSVNVQPNLQQKTATQNGEISADSGYDGLSSVIVNVSGGGSEELADVIFYDYDGTELYSYTATEFAELSSLPANPTHSGLIANGWNWTLPDAKAYVLANGKLDIGQMYSTADDKTHVKISLSQGYTSPVLSLCVDGEVDIDWGDNSTHTTLTGESTSQIQTTSAHQYAAPGNYEIVLDVTGTISFWYDTEDLSLLHSATSNYIQDAEYKKSIQEVNIGTGVNGLGKNSFKNCFNISKISIPSGLLTFYASCFSRCRGLQCIVVPSTVTSILTDAFFDCIKLKYMSLPHGVTSLANEAFKNCSALKRVCLPDSIATLSSYTFQSCHDLEAVSIPSSITTISSYAFHSCASLKDAVIPSSVTSIGSYAFNACTRLKNAVFPTGLNKLDTYTFFNCFKLERFTIPQSVTNISNYAFGRCESLAAISIPSGVTTLGNSILNGCNNLTEIHFQGTTPPSATSSSFTGVPADCVIYVPAGSLSAYTSAANYPSSATYTYIEE